MVAFVLIFGSSSLCSHFAYFRFASRRGVSTIPEGDTKKVHLMQCFMTGSSPSKDDNGRQGTVKVRRPVSVSVKGKDKTLRRLT